MLLGLPLLTRVSKQPVETPETCLVDGLCVEASVFMEAVAALTTLAFAVAFLLALTRLHDAVDALEEERERTRRERDAFEAFVNAVAAVDPENPRLTDGGVRTVSSDGRDTLSSVVDAYRDTVMDLDHYDDEYDDTLAEHMAAEFGDDVALAVSNGKILSPQLQRTLCAAGLEARDRRDRLLSALDAERASLASSSRTIRDVAGTLDDVDVDADRESLVADWQSVQHASSRIEDVLAERQDAIHDQRHLVGGGDGPTTVYEYLYADLESPYPVLSTGTELLDETKSVRRDVSRSLVRQ